MILRYGYWAAGGQRGDLTLKDTTSDYQVYVIMNSSFIIIIISKKKKIYIGALQLHQAVLSTMVFAFLI